MTNSPFRSRSVRAFTLIELLLVLAVVALMMGAAVPALRRPLAKSEMGRAAIEVKQAMSETRLAAIRTSRPHYFVFEPGAGRYYAGPIAAPSPEAMATLPPQIHFGANDAIPNTSMTEGNELETNLTDTSTLSPVTPPPSPPSTLPLATTDATMLTATQTILFRPDGRTDSTTIWLHQSDFKISLSVRGLTGECTIGSVERIAAPGEATDPSDSFNSFSTGSDEGFADRPKAPWSPSDGKATR